MTATLTDHSPLLLSHLTLSLSPTVCPYSQMPSDLVFVAQQASSVPLQCCFFLGGKKCMVVTQHTHTHTRTHCAPSPASHPCGTHCAAARALCVFVCVCVFAIYKYSVEDSFTNRVLLLWWGKELNASRWRERWPLSSWVLLSTGFSLALTLP